LALLRFDTPADPLVRASQRWCRALLRDESKSSYLATRVLPRRKREAVEAIYGVFRAADNIADEPGPSRAARLRGLHDIAELLERIREAGCASDAPWFPAVRRAFEGFPIVVADARRVIDACLADVDGVTCETLDDLEAYASAVAGSVGRCTMAILGAHDADSLDLADRLGVAMQLTNILRDRDEDGALGRDYLPARWRELADKGVSLVAARARERYAQAAVLVARLPNDGSRLAVAIAADLYEAMLDGRPTLAKRAYSVARCMVHCARN
jgi:phytoene/squalene synthetase